MSKKIFIASDHGGFVLKNEIIEHLKQSDFEVEDLGPETDDRVDYPDFAKSVVEKVIFENGAQIAVETGDYLAVGILICTSGQGMAMTANKHPEIRAALCWTPELAELARGHNNANILCLGAKFVDSSTARQIVDRFLSSPFEGGRHTGRVEKISL